MPRSSIVVTIATPKLPPKFRILPWATGVLPQLTPIAAGALAGVMVLALGHHLQHKDPVGKMGPPAVLLALAVFVAFGRGAALSA